MAKRTVTEADRQMGRYNLLTTGRVAEMLHAEGMGGEDRITADTVRSWIEDDENGLRAVDLRKKGAKRPAWFIKWEWVEDFLERRSANLPDKANAA